MYASTLGRMTSGCLGILQNNETNLTAVFVLIDKMLADFSVFCTFNNRIYFIYERSRISAGTKANPIAYSCASIKEFLKDSTGSGDRAS
jgi:hypothetical protein